MASPTTTRVFSTRSASLVMSPHSAPQLNAAEKAARDKFVQNIMDSDKLAVLMADRKRIDEMINEAKAAKKAERDAQRANQPNKLERVIAYQQTYPKWVGVAIAKMVLARVDAGQSQEEANAAVMATIQQRTDEGLALLASEAEARAALPAQAVAPIALVAHKASKSAKASE